MYYLPWIPVFCSVWWLLSGRWSIRRYGQRGEWETAGRIHRCLSAACYPEAAGLHALSLTLKIKQKIFFSIDIFYRRQKKLRKGNVFKPVCHSVHSRGSIHPLPRQTAPGRHSSPQADTPIGNPPPRRPLQRTVRILLECILVKVNLSNSDPNLIKVVTKTKFRPSFSSLLDQISWNPGKYIFILRSSLMSF